jgi:hypothetical protein
LQIVGEVELQLRRLSTMTMLALVGGSTVVFTSINDAVSKL